MFVLSFFFLFGLIDATQAAVFFNSGRIQNIETHLKEF